MDLKYRVLLAIILILGYTTRAKLQDTSEECLSLDPCQGEPVDIETEAKICFPLSGGDYDNDMDCVWNVTAPVGYVVRFETTYMDLEWCPGCACDYVALHDGVNAADPLLDRMCEAGAEATYSTHSHMFIHFSSDHTDIGAGFNASISFTLIPRVAFHAVRFTPQDAGPAPAKLYFEGVMVNEGSGFDGADNTFTCPLTGNYYFSICAGAQAGRQVNAILRVNGQHRVSAIRTSVIHSGVDMVERSVVLGLEQGDVVDILLQAHTAVHSDPVSLQTSWTGFSLPFMHDNDAALFAARPDNVTLSGNLEFMVKRFVDVGGWGSEDDVFLAPVSGVYFVEINTGCSMGAFSRITHNEETMAYAYSSPLSLATYDTCSTAVLLSCSQNDSIALYASGQFFSNRDLQSSISAFIFSMTDLPRPAFSVARTTSMSTPGVVGFDITAYEEDWGVNAASGVFTCQVSGIYFLYATVRTRTDSITDVNIMKNSHEVSSLVSTYSDGSASLSKALLIDLTVGDTIHLDLVDGELYSTLNRFIVFSSFLLYEPLEFP